MPVKLKGKTYYEVSERVTAFRKPHPISEGWGIDTTIYAIDDAVVIVQARITDPEGRTVASGLAEEVRTSKGVNSTSALENCETSAIGRALAAAGYGGDGAYASADELAAAITHQKNGTRVTGPAPTPDAKMAELRKLIDQLPDGDRRTKWVDWLAKSHTPHTMDNAIERLRGEVGNET